MSIGTLPIYKVDGHRRSIYVYMLTCRDDGGPHYIKFGHSIRPGIRISELMVGCPVPGQTYSFMLVDSDQKALYLEKALHFKFAGRRTKGEWFKFFLDDPAEFAELDAGIRACVATLKVQNPVWTRIDLKKWSEADKQRKAIWAAKKIENAKKFARRQRILAEERRAEKEAKARKFQILLDNLDKEEAA